MKVAVIGAGSVGRSIARELIHNGHEVLLIDRDVSPEQTSRVAEASWIIGDASEISTLTSAQLDQYDHVVCATGDDKVNLVVSLLAKTEFAVPRTVARVNNPRNEELFRHLGVDEIISPTRMALAAIEQDIPVHELLHLARLEGGELELVEAQVGEDSPAIGRHPSDIALPEGCTLFVLIRDEKAHAIRPDITFRSGDKVLAITSGDCEAELHRQLIGTALEG